MTLRLADAIRLGSTLMTCGKYTPIERIGEEKAAGCALEMALAAVGRPELHWADARQIWPWLTTNSFSGLGLTYEVAGKFDVEVARRHTLTLDQLCDWVDSIDPTPRCEPPVQEPSPVETRQESTVSHG